MIRAIILGLGGLLLGGIQPAVAQDAVAGKKVAGMCRTCHGLDGYAQIPVAPHIGGEPVTYLESQLTAFKTGTRTNEMMSVVAAGLSGQQIADVAAWYASQQASAEFAGGVGAEDAPEACVACHGADGIGVVSDVPNLAGEGSIYIETQLKAFRGGKRHHEVMSVIAKDMSDDEIRSVAQWYSAIELYIVSAEQP